MGRDESRMAVKTYVVMQRVPDRITGVPGTRVLGVFLTCAKAKSLSDAMPGAWWEKHIATK